MAKAKLELVAPSVWPPPDAPPDGQEPPGYWRTMARLWLQSRRRELRARMSAKRASQALLARGRRSPPAAPPVAAPAGKP